MIMLTLCFGAAYWYIAADPFSVLAASALIILLIDPNSLWQISFQLTFVCMFAIFSLYPRLERFHLTSVCAALTRNKFPGSLIAPFEEAFWLSLAVNIMVLPLTAYYFQGISLAGFLANIVLVPLTGFLVSAARVGQSGNFCLQRKPCPAGFEAWGLFSGGFQALAGLVQSACRGATSGWGVYPSSSWCVFYAALALLLTPWRLRTKAIGVTLLMVFGFGMTFVQHALHRPRGARESCKSLSLMWVKGVQRFCVFPPGQPCWSTAGVFSNEAFDVGRAVLAPFLWYSGIRRLDYVVLSHDHPDHRNGLAFVLSHFDVGCLWESGLAEGSQAESELAAIAARRKDSGQATRRRFSAGTPLTAAR